MQKTKNVPYLPNCRLLAGIEAKDFARLCECLSVRERNLFDKETFLFEDAPCDKIGLVISGSVQMSRRRTDGGRLVLETVMPGDVFGSTYAFRDGSKVGITLTAVGETTVLLFETHKFTRPVPGLGEAHLRLLHNLLAIMSHKTLQMKQKLRILSKRTIRERVMATLRILSHRAQSHEFDMPFDRQAFADYLCVDRCALSAELSKLQRDGVIAFDRRRFRLINVP